ncbi:Uncharacterized mitochondrial protein AtMg01250 [Linum grandiflorum]
MKRFRKCLGKIINASQNAFLDNRQIVNVAANELMDSRRASGKNCILLKHDLEKAFDSVSWDCMLFMLKRFNFPNTWISWIQSCISSVHYSVLVNGAPYGFFSSKRGIRQGDSISSHLFICDMEILMGMLSKANDCDFFKGFMMNEREGEGEVTHLLYADDALIFCEDSEEQVIFGVCILVITLEVGRLGKRSLVKIFSFGTLGLLIREEVMGFVFGSIFGFKECFSNLYYEGCLQLPILKMHLFLTFYLRLMELGMCLSVITSEEVPDVNYKI